MGQHRNVVGPEQGLDQPWSTDTQPVTVSQTSRRPVTTRQNDAIVTGEHAEPISAARSATITTQ